MNRSLIVTALILIVLGNTSAHAVNLLSGGDFEPTGLAIPGWTLEEFATGSGTSVDAAEVVFNHTPESGSYDLWLKSWVGGQDPNGPTLLANAVLSQTVSASVGETYTFSGFSRWQSNYSGGVATLDPNSPLGAVASPTTNTMELAFLDSGGSVIGSPTMLDVSTEQNNFDLWIQHTLVGLAPAGTVSARVTADGKDMVYNSDPDQSAYYDTFSLSGALEPLTELLTNPGLDDALPTGLEDWTVTSDDPEDPSNDEIIRTESFANHTSGGVNGVWLSSFFGETGTEVDGMLSQTVAGVEGGNYSLTGWSRFEANYTASLTFFELSFLDPNAAVIGSPITLDLSTEQMNDGTWREHTLNGTAPAGTTAVRVSAGMVDGVNPMADPQSAFFDDFVLELATGLDGDFNEDGVVDGIDFLKWQRGESPEPLSAADLALWEANYGATSLAASVNAVPEPMTAAMLVMGTVVVLLGGVHRKRSA